MQLLKLDGNTLGKLATDALMVAMARAHSSYRSLAVSMHTCDTTRADARLFNVTAPAGHYELQLEDPYDLMIATELLWAANHREGCRFEKLWHTKPFRKRRRRSSKDKEKRTPPAAAVVAAAALELLASSPGGAVPAPDASNAPAPVRSQIELYRPAENSEARLGLERERSAVAEAVAATSLLTLSQLDRLSKVRFFSCKDACRRHSPPIPPSPPTQSHRHSPRCRRVWPYS